MAQNGSTRSKYKYVGEIECYKARLIAKEDTQIEGIGFHEIFARVAKLVTVRTVLAIVTQKGWIIQQLDINNAFFAHTFNERSIHEGSSRFCHE